MLATYADGERVRIEPLLHGVEQMLMLPSREPWLGPGRADSEAARLRCAAQVELVPGIRVVSG